MVVGPVHHLLAVVELFVGIAALAEARGIADGEAVGRIHDDLRQLAVDVTGAVEKCILECRRRIGPRGQDGAPCGALRHAAGWASNTLPTRQ